MRPRGISNKCRTYESGSSEVMVGRRPRQIQLEEFRGAEFNVSIRSNRNEPEAGVEVLGRLHRLQRSEAQSGISTGSRFIDDEIPKRTSNSLPPALRPDIHPLHLARVG